MGIESKEKIHRITSIKRLSEQIKKELQEYNDPKTFLGWSKRKRKWVMKRFK